MDGRYLFLFPQTGEKRTQLVSFSTFRWHNPPGQSTQDVYGGLQAAPSQQGHPLSERVQVWLIKTTGISSLQERRAPATNHMVGFLILANLDLC